jgi:hypothetical protein
MAITRMRFLKANFLIKTRVLFPLAETSVFAPPAPQITSRAPSHRTEAIRGRTGPDMLNPRLSQGDPNSDRGGSGFPQCEIGYSLPFREALFSVLMA